MASENSDRFALPARLEGQLGAVHSYWQSLKRGQANMPFSDDVKLDPLGEAASHVMLIDVFEGPPQRFRFAIVGEHVAKSAAEGLDGQFVHELGPSSARDDLLAQCQATVESHAPTYYRNATTARILLPLWGDGHICMLMGASTAP